MNFFSLFFLSLILMINCEPKPPVGALLEVQFTGKVGFNLDEIPSYLLKQVKDYIKKSISKDVWLERAKQQIIASIYRQVFRAFYFAPKLQLTLPPEQVWTIKFTGDPKEELIQNHLYISRTYTFYSVVIGSANSINASEPLLNKINGKYTDTFIVPVDPEFVFQRSGYACVDEASFSLDTVTSENVLTYFDQECKVEPYKPFKNRTYEMNLQNCHWTSFPNLTCLEALKNTIGYISLKITWKRIAWDTTLANKYQYGKQTSDYADIVGVKEKMLNEINIGYKYFDANSCALEEGSSSEFQGCVRAPGWRQLLRFTSSSINVGKTVLHLGDVYANEFIQRGLYEFDPCHLHYHFQHYENYLFGNVTGRKTGFCLQTTWRYHNNAWTDFNTPYSYCSYQGISVGWGDDYYSGLDCQWIDVTGVGKGKYNLKTVLNPDNFLCEGSPILHANKSYSWIATNFKFGQNQTVYRQACNFTKNYKANNLEDIQIDFKGKNSIVTLPCKRKGIIGPLKDCGFQIQHDNLVCESNKTSKIKLHNSDKLLSGVIRLCETSKVLGYSTQCEYINKLSNLVLKPNQIQTIEFTCPKFRSYLEPGGFYSILVSNLLPNQQIPKIIRI